MLNQQKPALEYLQHARELLDSDSELLFNAAKIYVRLRQPDVAMNFLQKSVAAGYSVPCVRDDPMFKTLANNVQFQSIVGK
jgi:predicted Zn-dependent protease